MTKRIRLSLLWMFFGWLSTSFILADTVVFTNGLTVEGRVISREGDEILVITDTSAFNFSKTSIKEIKADPGAVPPQDTNRLVGFKAILPILARQKWAADVRPIPATVIDKGILKNIPYVSFRCDDDYEVNIYGDLAHPAGVEVGVYRRLVADVSAKSNCVAFIAELLMASEDKEILRGLKMQKDLMTREGMTFEVTPPSAEDAYFGWWVSVYSEQELNRARASDDELKNVSVAKSDLTKEPGREQGLSNWTAEDLKFARPDSIKATFVTKSGMVISNAEVKPYIEGVSIIWRCDGSGGIVKLVELPEELRVRFGYDPVKAAAAELAEQARRASVAQARAALATQTTTNSSHDDLMAYTVPPNSSSQSYSGGGRVYVHGYTRKDGTYVHAYTRSSSKK